MSQSFIKKPAAGAHSRLSGLGVLSSEQADLQSMKGVGRTSIEPIGDQHSGTVGAAYSTDPELLRQCAASGQMSAQQVARESALASQGACDAAPAVDVFKIVRASDGVQVLFRKGVNSDFEPSLFQMTELDGSLAQLDMAFEPNDQGWNALDAAFAQSGVEQADAVRRAVKSLIGQP